MMHIITIKGMRDDGAYAVLNEFGEKIVFMFENPDDIPEKSPIKNIDKEQVNKEIENLNEKKSVILNKIEKILREQPSS